MAQAADSSLPDWLTWHELPVGRFAMVALSNLTHQKNDLEISNTVYITEKVPLAQNGLSEYHHYMAITESKEILENEKHLKKGSGNKPRSDFYIVVLVRRESTGALAGCFLFDSDPSSHRQNAHAPTSAYVRDCLAAKLLFQRVYPSTGVKASDWYRCLYAALFQEFLLSGYRLPVQMLSAGLLPEIRRAPDKVRSLPLYSCFLARGAGP
jgi:hypothetical protein